MADPHHIEELDGLDRLTVRLYRSGIALSAVGLLLAAAVYGAGQDEAWGRATWTLVLAGAALCIADMHLYAKHIRWVIGASGWLGAVLVFGADAATEPLQPWVRFAGVGFVFVSLSGFALKEQFCFRIPLLRAVPLLLAASLVPLLAGIGWAAAALLGVAGLVYGALAVAKMRMPLHFDVGDKSKYQV